MRTVKLIGIILTLLMIISIIPMNRVNAEGQPDERLKAYKLILSRTLNLTYLSPDLRGRIEKIVKSRPTTAQETLNLIANARSILEEIEREAEGRKDIGEMVKRERLMLIITTSMKIAQEKNDTELVKYLSNTLDMVNKGDIKGAEDSLSRISRNISEIRIEDSSKAVERSITTMFSNIPSNRSAVKAILRAISNINTTMNMMMMFEERLAKTNASKTATSSLQRAIQMLNGTTGILKGVIEIVQTTGLEGKTGNITKRFATSQISDKIKESREDISRLLNETTALEKELNKTLYEVRDNLSEALTLLNESESLLSAGDVGGALKQLAGAKVLIGRANRALERYEETFERGLKERKLQKYVNKKLMELEDSYKRQSTRFKELYDYAVKVNATQALDLLKRANITLNEISRNLNESRMMIANNSYNDALNLINKAEGEMDKLSGILDNVENLTKTVAQSIAEIQNEISELRKDLKEMRERANASLTGIVLDKALGKVRELVNRLNNAENLVENGDVKRAGEIVKEVKEDVEKLDGCIGKAGDLLKEIEGLRDKIKLLRGKYSKNQNILRRLNITEGILKNAESTLSEAIGTINTKLIKNAERLVKNTEKNISEVEETHLVKFRIVDDRGAPVINASIMFNGTEYHNGEFTYVSGGEYSLGVGKVPEGYMFDHWECRGRIEINNVSSSMTTTIVNGDGGITLTLKRTKPKKMEYMISFHIVNDIGKPITNASIIFNGKEYREGEYVKESAGTYPLSVGEIPNGYEFGRWNSLGGIEIENTTSESTMATVNNSGTIYLILREKMPEEYMIKFYVKDTLGNIISNATIIFNGTEYSSGESVNEPEGTYSLSVGVISSGYKFKLWSSEGGIIVKNPTSKDTKAIVKGDGVIVLILEKEEAQEYSLTFYIKDDEGNIIFNASIIFNGKRYFNGQSIVIKAGEYEIRPENIPNGYKFAKWNISSRISIENTLSPETEVTISGGGTITLILKRTEV